jgi:CheY-like chemotaxis protein
MKILKILIVEDKPYYSALLTLIIEELLPQSEIYIAASVGEAVDMFTKHVFDLITLDGSLNEGTHGRDLLRVMAPEQIKITIIHSGEDDFNKKCFSEGMAVIGKDTSDLEGRFKDKIFSLWKLGEQ